MSQQPLRFALFGNEYQPKKSSSVEKILSYLVNKGAEIYIDRPFYNFLTTTLGLDVAATGVFDGYNFDSILYFAWQYVGKETKASHVDTNDRRTLASHLACSL